MNRSITRGSQEELISLFCESDRYLDPQALILDPKNIIAVSKEIVDSGSYIEAAVRAGLKALDIIQEGIDTQQLLLEDREIIWIDMIREELTKIPYDESDFIALVEGDLDPSKTTLSEYGL